MGRLIKTQYLVLGLIAALLLLPLLVSAQDYLPLSAIPGVQETGGSLADYVNALFLISISVGALLAVVKIAIGGVQYMMSDVVTTKQDARSTITGALLGLGILLATFVVLWTINPNLVSLDVLGGADPVAIQPVANPSSGPQPGTNERVETMECSQVFSNTCSQAIADCQNSAGYVSHEIVNGEVKCVINTQIANISCTVSEPTNTCNEALCDGEWIQLENGNSACSGTMLTSATTLEEAVVLAFGDDVEYTAYEFEEGTLPQNEALQVTDWQIECEEELEGNLEQIRVSGERTYVCIY